MGSRLIGGAGRGLQGCNYGPNPPKQKALGWGTLKMVGWASPQVPSALGLAPLRDSPLRDEGTGF